MRKTEKKLGISCDVLWDYEEKDSRLFMTRKDRKVDGNAKRSSQLKKKKKNKLANTVKGNDDDLHLYFANPFSSSFNIKNLFWSPCSNMHSCSL